MNTLYTWLLDREFVTLSDVPGGKFNQYVVLGRDSTRVELRATRGDWDLTLSLDGGETFWQLDNVEAYLLGRSWDGERSPDAHQAELIMSRLSELEARWQSDPHMKQGLYELGDAWVSRRFGIPIPPGGFPRSRKRAE